MKNKKIISLMLVLSFTLVMVAMVGCTPEKRPNTTQDPARVPNEARDMLPDNNMNDRNLMNDYDNDMMDNNNRDMMPGNDRNNLDNNYNNNTQTRSDANQLAKSVANKFPEVNTATLVLANNIAYCGIDLQANLPAERAKVVKNEVSKMIKKQKPEINTVYVTEDADTYTRLQVIAKDIENGKPISGFLNELKNVFNRITPSME
ncbi:sporulation lipoprotein, YhcN/YlaJ family [Desulfonispora thiosulfatigenes DSM 11270]|uniref:Sporulation lipoprotein, YhcN/YlaJ family n=1 Tax=Desulfonispora thiosulfatigenes DSM 11270 TaxID=656914 RepID=A0A1W1VGA4_DESTI|nr:YhcN/YlaJ family sporulation lipoprotein [Desulfonispora thiosulfatigenes]SMB92407.1 sporulation lipoprotein, YhcN/YlaJ family [Desulfonispora thiosulfatigenes DSM 11270]